MRIAFLLCMGLTLTFRFLTLSSPTRDAHLDETIGEDVSFEAVVIREPVHKENNQRMLVELENGARVTVSMERYPKFMYGDRLKLSGKVRLPEDFETDTGRMFAYDAYLEKDGIAYQMLYPSIELVRSGEGNILFRTLFKIRRAFLASLRNSLPEPHSSLVSGITIGVEDGLGKKYEDLFRAVGLIHIIVLSGYNITIVSESVIRLLGFLPRLIALSSGASAVVLFVIMAGASAATIRAAIMAILVVVARMIGRKYDISRALLIAGCVMVFHNPHILLHDPSFQLSFLATLGLVYGTPLVKGLFQKLPETFGIRESAISTSATQLFVMPLILYQMGQMSLAALPANILVLWSMPAIMFSTLLTGVLGFISPFIALPFSFVAQLLSEYILFVAEALSKVPHASVTFPPLHWSVLIAMYVALGFWIWTHSSHKAPKGEQKS